jgi:hypothetical protein
MFIVGRVIAEIGSAGVANGAVTTISVILPTKKQALFMGLNMGILIYRMRRPILTETATITKFQI